MAKRPTPKMVNSASHHWEPLLLTGPLVVRLSSCCQLDTYRVLTPRHNTGTHCDFICDYSLKSLHVVLFSMCEVARSSHTQEQKNVREHVNTWF